MPMPNRIVHFELFRYQLLPLTQNVQGDMFSAIGLKDIDSVDGLRARKNEIFEMVLRDFPSLSYHDSPINHKIDLHSPPWFVMEINTEKLLRREKPDFDTESIDTWPHVVVIINNDPNSQIIAISKNTRAFSSGSVVAKILAEAIDRFLKRYYLTVQVEALFERTEFWNLVKKYRGKLRSIKFELITPNMSNISKTLEIDLFKDKRRDKLP